MDLYVSVYARARELLAAAPIVTEGTSTEHPLTPHLRAAATERLQGVYDWDILLSVSPIPLLVIRR